MHLPGKVCFSKQESQHHGMHFPHGINIPLNKLTRNTNLPSNKSNGTIAMSAYQRLHKKATNEIQLTHAKIPIGFKLIKRERDAASL
jgi:hypothetical protein